VFVDAAGGFSARFPSKPSQFNEPGSLGPSHFTIHVAVARTARGNTLVEADDLTSAIPQRFFKSNLVARVKGIAATSNLSLHGQPTAVLFRHQPAEQAYYTASGSRRRHRAVGFFSGGSRLILAPISVVPSVAASLIIR
jgi:hypothetical protein